MAAATTDLSELCKEISNIALNIEDSFIAVVAETILPDVRIKFSEEANGVCEACEYNSLSQ